MKNDAHELLSKYEESKKSEYKLMIQKKLKEKLLMKTKHFL